MMADEERKTCDSVVDVGGVGCGLNGIDAGVKNGVLGNGNYSAESSRECLRTYKRRKHNSLLSPKIELLQEGKLLTYRSSNYQDKMVKEQGDNGHQLKCPRNDVLEQMCKSISETGGSLHGCLKNVLSHTGSSCRTADKDSVHSHGGENKSQPHTALTINGLHNAGEVHVDAMPNHLPSKSDCTITELCQRTFVDILMSEKFAQLCSLLMENFSGMRVDEFIDIKNINSRMENGTYETSPVLFHSDIKQLWTKVQKVGTQMVSLGNSLLVKSNSACHEHVAGSVPEIGKHEVPSEEQNDASVVKPFACGKCGVHADGKDCLVCDSCEETYHVSCIEPAVTEIPARNWYCLKCTTGSIQSPHHNCVVCDRLNAGDNVVSDNSNDPDDGLKSDENLYCCSICRGKVENNRDMKVCGHVYCPHKYYHVRCLTGKQLSTHGPCWYCPSCLCSICLVDKDDDKIILCDACDNAYHIYCMEPPLDRIPNGKWFCRKCDAGLKKIGKVRRAYEIVQNRSEMKGEIGNVKNEA
ncbi:PHD finger protein EHD3-like isoform X2 [Impatiens glandulifera]|uniref:PHD finger protein EHD3-like isoform X2 n=1 Tax=Impatiens glandulifera TaxID=253017 RepID=UPI001FB164B1|nr:PHD finger protein EHD3-like isoform X2 [Impatiens glandulifera]